MPEARDRLVREEDIIGEYARQIRSMGSGGSGGRPIRVFRNLPDRTTAARTPFRWGATAMTGTRVAVGVAAGRTTGALGTPRNGRGRELSRSPATRIDQNQGSARGRGRSRHSILPSWYPRAPLQDITAIVRAIERTRARMRENEGLNTDSPLPQEQPVPDQTESTSGSSGAQLEHEASVITPVPTIGLKPFPLSVPKMLDITNQENDESGFITPQKKLLNSIDTVEKVVMEELRRLKRTPTAKKAEREKRVRTLMSMR